MTNKLIPALLSSAFLITGGMSVGCDRTIEKKETTEVNRDGSKETSSEETTVKSDGTVETTTEKEVTPPANP